MKTSWKTFIALAFALLSPLAASAHMKFEESHELPMVYLNILVRAGSASDPKGKLGLANIAGEMLSRGTKKRTKLEFMREIERLGASVASTTTFEGTIISASFLSTSTDAVLALIGEMLLEPLFDGSELQKLKKEVIGSILAEKSNDARVAWLHHARFIYGDHPYGQPILGTERTVARIGLADAKAFYEAYFGPAAMTMLGSGDADGGALGRWWDALMAKLGDANPKAKPMLPVSEPAIPQGRRMLLVDKPKSTQSQVMVAGKAPRPEDDDYYALVLGNHVFGGGTFEARLMKEIRVKRGWTYGASNKLGFNRRRSHYNMYFFPKTADAIPALSLALQMMQDLVDNGVTREELAFSKSALVNRSPFEIDTARKRLQNATNELIYDLPEGFFRNLASRYESVDYGDVLPALRHWLRPGDLTITVLGDAAQLKEGLSKIPDVNEVRTVHYLAE